MIAAVATVVAVAMMAACHSASNDGAALPGKNGTLYLILSTNPVETLDPQEISTATDANVSKEIDRTLTTTNAKGQLVPDLATDTGRPSNNDTVWEFTLKPGVKWSDGSPVTCADIQYGVERRFANQIDKFGGLRYQMDDLADTANYEGPFVSTNSTLPSIVCEDTRNVAFHLNRPIGDFGYTVSVNTFAPIKKGADSNRAPNDAKAFSYDPISDGPYMIDPTKTKQDDNTDPQTDMTHLELVRNPYWDPSTDSTRKAYPSRIVIDYDPNRPEVTNNLINSTGTYANAISLDGDVTPNFVQQVINDPVLSKRAIAGNTGSTRYYAINTRRLALPCRQALEYAFDKRSFRFVLGGAVAGPLATSIIPPNLPAHADFDLYETNTQPDGDVAAAQKLWTAANKCPSSINVTYLSTSPVYQQEVGTIVAAYQRIGVLVHPVPIPAPYWPLIGNPNSDYDMMYAGWVPDWPNGSAVIPPLFSSQQVTDVLTGRSVSADNQNYSMLVSPTIDNQIKQANAAQDLSTQYHLWGELDQEAMKEAAVIPVIYPDALRMSGSNVRGATISPSFGQPDIATLGVVK
ncbi:MAG TPA: ABC transporter substrate-binding protein [Micromonosporaceae bacterium]